MDISKRGIDLIVSFEGKHTAIGGGRYRAYLDKLAKPAVWTIYCGLTKGVSPEMVVTEEEGDRMFAKELAIYEDAVERLIDVPLNQNMFDALVSFVYNCGPGALEKSTLRKVLNQGKYEQVPAQLMRWTRAGGVSYAGLERRRAAEGALFMEPVAEVATHEDEVVVSSPAMPQRVEEAPAGSASKAMKESQTIRGALMAMLAALASGFSQSYDWLFGVAREAGPEILSLKTTIGPFDPLLKATPVLLTGVVIAGCAVVISRRLSAAKEGRIG